jgi:two-component system sensor histidine kinase PilS (NtrC family)
VPTTGTKKKLADLGAVASGLAHEIRNPLNSLYINSQILAEMLAAFPDGEGARREELLALAQSNLKVTRRLNDLLTEFLRFARPPSMEIVAADLNKVVSETLRFLEVDFSRRGIELVVRLHPERLPLLADEKQLKQALLNLLLNAEEAMDKERKRVRVTTGLYRGRPFVRVQDNGRGIPRADRRQIFRLFFTTRKSGSGLGLPIVRQIIRDHRGTINVRSREGHGTTVTILMPSESQFKAALSTRPPARLLPEKIR